MSRKQEILEKARTVFLEKGFHHTTMKDIVDSLAIKRTTIYDYFSSKEMIVFELIEQMFKQYPLSKPEGGFIDRLNDLTRQMLFRVKENIDIYKLLFTALPALDVEMNERITAWQLPFYNYLNEIMMLSELTDSDKASFMFLYRSLISTKLSDYIKNEDMIYYEQDSVQIITILKRWLSNGST